MRERSGKNVAQHTLLRWFWQGHVVSTLINARFDFYTNCSSCWEEAARLQSIKSVQFVLLLQATSRILFVWLFNSCCEQLTGALKQYFPNTLTTSEVGKLRSRVHIWPVDLFFIQPFNQTWRNYNYVKIWLHSNYTRTTTTTTKHSRTHTHGPWCPGMSASKQVAEFLPDEQLSWRKRTASSLIVLNREIITSANDSLALTACLFICIICMYS